MNIDLSIKISFLILSYDLDDVSFLNSFIDFYMSKQQEISFIVDNYKNIFDNLLSLFDVDSFPSKPSFEDIIQNSGFYQQLSLLSENKQFVLPQLMLHFLKPITKSS